MENRRLGQTKDRYDVHHRTQLESSEKFCLLVRVLKTLGHRLDAFVAQVYPGASSSDEDEDEDDEGDEIDEHQYLRSRNELRMAPLPVSVESDELYGPYRIDR